MALRIGQFVTTCHVPRRHRQAAEVVERLARGRFARDLGAHLGPSLSRQPAIIRIRMLPMRVVMPASDLNEDALSAAWMQAFSKALFTALAYPEGAGAVEIFRADSAASFVASAIRDLLDGTAATKWQYAEFEELFRLGGTRAALSLLTMWPRECLAILLELAQARVLDRLLARFDDLALERLFLLLADTADAGPPPLSIGDLITVAKLVLRHTPPKVAALSTRGYALGLYVEAHRTGSAPRSPRVVFHSLLALTILLTGGEISAASGSDDQTWKNFPPGTAGSDDAIWKSLPPAVASVLQSVDRETRATPPAPRAVQLAQLLRDLRVNLHVPLPAAKSAVPARWITSGWCGMFFLAGTLERLNWAKAWQGLSHFQSGGISCLIAALALSITGKFETDPRTLDEAVALFCGYLDQPDLAHLRTVLQTFPEEARRDVLAAALPGENFPDTDEAATSWAATCDLLATRLLLSFAARIRGFRQAARPSIVRAFIARPGRIRVEPGRILVMPQPSPYDVALHIASADSTVESPAWLGGHTIEFELKGL